MQNGISNQASLRRLMRDLKEITNEPIQGVSAAPVNDNLFEWHGNLDTSVLKGGNGGAFHYVMTFKNTYPKAPPVVRLSTDVPHYNVFAGGSYICLDMLERGEWSYESEKSRPYTGWSSCYTVRSLLMQLQSFLMDETRIFSSRVPNALQSAKSFKCPTCEHKPNNVWPPFAKIADIQAVATKIPVKMPTLDLMLPSAALSLEQDKMTLKAAAKPVLRQGDVWTLVTRKSGSGNGNAAGVARISYSQAAAPVTMLPSPVASLQNRGKVLSEAPKEVFREADGWTLVARKPISDNRNAGRSNKFAPVNRRNRLPSGKKQPSAEIQPSAEKQPPKQKQPSAEKPKAAEEQQITPTVTEEPKPAEQVQASERKDTKTARKNRARAQKRAALRLQNQQQPPAVAKQSDIPPAPCSIPASKVTVKDTVISSGNPQGSLGDVPYEVLISIVLRLPTLKDILALASTCRFLHNVVEDGWMWREVFSRQYPKSNLTAASMRDWKYAYAMEHNNIISETVCFHTKKNVNEEILGIPIRYTTDRAKKVNYIYSTMDFIGLTAYKDENVRKTVWKEEFTSFMPLYFMKDHFIRARSAFESSIIQLSPGLPTQRFNPKMVLDVLPKLMNSYVVQLTKEDTYASERAVHGYFLIYRLLIATLELYPQLKQEIYKRVQNFVLNEDARNKVNYPSLGDFIPLVTISSFSWNAVAPAVLSESYDRNAQWILKAHPDLAKVRQISSKADRARLEKSFESSLVSKRLMMFHVYFMRTFRRKPLTAMAAELDRFYGQPTAAVTRSFQAQIKRILAVKTWPEFYAFIQRPCPSPLQLTQTLEQSIRNSLRRRYHTKYTIKPRVPKESSTTAVRNTGCPLTCATCYPI